MSFGVAPHYCTCARVNSLQLLHFMGCGLVSPTIWFSIYHPVDFFQVRKSDVYIYTYILWYGILTISPCWTDKHDVCGKAWNHPPRFTSSQVPFTNPIMIRHHVFSLQKSSPNFDSKFRKVDVHVSSCKPRVTKKTMDIYIYIYELCKIYIYTYIYMMYSYICICTYYYIIFYSVILCYKML